MRKYLDNGGWLSFHFVFVAISPRHEVASGMLHEHGEREEVIRRVVAIGRHPA